MSISPSGTATAITTVAAPVTERTRRSPQFSPARAKPARVYSPMRGPLLPMGGGYAELLPEFARTLFARALSAHVDVTVVPASYASNAFAMTDTEHTHHLVCAERRRHAIELALREVAPAGTTCSVALAPILVRSDAENEANLRFFGPKVGAVFLLGGDQAVAMRVLRGTPIEAALEEIHQRGGIIAGTSAGAAMQSHTMLAGFHQGYNIHNSLHAGATAVWDTGDERGLAFGTRAMIFDQHFFQRGRLGRLLEAMTRPGAPGLGVGIDAYTGLHVHGDGRMDEVFGCYSVAVLDGESYGAVENAHYGGPHSTISLRNVLVHLLAPGAFSYDLQSRQHSLAPQLRPAARRFEGLARPAGAGPLFLCGGMSESRRAADAAWRRFMKLSDAQGGAALIAHDPDAVDHQQLVAACLEWLHGKPLWLEGVLAALAGTYHCAGLAPQTTRDPEDLNAQEAAQIAAKRALMAGNVVLQRGYGLLAANFEPRTVENAGWGRLFALAYEHAEQPSFGLGANTTLAVTDNGAEVLGEEAVIALDLRTATRDLGDNRAYVVANGWLDIYADGEALELHAADARYCA